MILIRPRDNELLLVWGDSQCEHVSWLVCLSPCIAFVSLPPRHLVTLTCICKKKKENFNFVWFGFLKQAVVLHTRKYMCGHSGPINVTGKRTHIANRRRHLSTPFYELIKTPRPNSSRCMWVSSEILGPGVDFVPFILVILKAATNNKQRLIVRSAY